MVNAALQLNHIAQNKIKKQQMHKKKKKNRCKMQSFGERIILYIKFCSILTVLTRLTGCLVARNVPSVCACLCVSLRVKTSLFQLHNNKRKMKQRVTLLFKRGLVFCQTSYQHVWRWVSIPSDYWARNTPTYWHYLLWIPLLAKIHA